MRVTKRRTCTRATIILLLLTPLLAGGMGMKKVTPEDIKNLGQDEGLVLGSVRIQGGKDLLGRKRWVLAAEKTLPPVGSFGEQLRRDYLTPRITVFSVKANRDGDEVVFLTKLPAGPYHFANLVQPGVSSADEPMWVPFVVQAGKTVYVGRLIIQFPPGLISASTQLRLQVEDDRQATVDRGAKEYGVALSDVVTDLMTVYVEKPVDVPERWSFRFDDRKWHMGHQAADHQEAVREYVLVDQTVDNWTELVTSHYYASGVPLRSYFEQVKVGLSRGCPSLGISVLEESEDTILYEWQHDGCQGYPPQHQIERAARSGTGTLVLSFVEKTTQLSPEKRNRWLTILKDASIPPADGSTR